MSESVNEAVVEEIRIDLTLPPSEVSSAILRLPLADHDHWIALWMVQPNVLADFRYRPMPTIPEKVKKDYLNLPPHTRKKMNEEPGLYVTFWKDNEIFKYYEDRQTIRGINWSNLKNLKWLKIMIEDESIKNKIDSMINNFIDIEDHPNPINVGDKDKHWQD